jgi:SAM-dependent methyltransferase
MQPWWKTFFDFDYLRIWGMVFPDGETIAQLDGLWQLLQLREGSRVLDAPCGYGRLSRPLAERGAIVVGVDQSEQLLSHAEKTRGSILPEQLRYIHHDLREPLLEGGFDAAINMFSSLGYGSEEDDLAILTTLRCAVHPMGQVLVETNHRDAVVANLSRGKTPSRRLPDGTLVIEESEFDAVSGRANIRWFWSGPNGSGKKSASLRLYTATELVQLMERAGLRFLSAHRGCSTELFKAEGENMGGRIAVLAGRMGD